jgi:hypothetical protein
MDTVVSKQTNIITLSIDLLDRPNFHSCGFEKLNQLRKIVFDRCFIRHLTNTTFVYIKIYFRTKQSFQNIRGNGNIVMNLVQNLLFRFL